MGSPVDVLFNEIREFETSNKVPKRLLSHIWSEVDTPCIWFKALSEALKQQKEKPHTLRQVSQFVYETLHGLHKHHLKDLKVFLRFYSLPLTKSLEATLPGVKLRDPSLFQMDLCYVNHDAIGDGDGFTIQVIVDEWTFVPPYIMTAVNELKKLDLTTPEGQKKAFYLRSNIAFDSYDFFRMQYFGDHERLTCQRKIRLRGIDAPELRQEYGKEAKEALQNTIGGKFVMVSVFEIDPFGRLIADVYNEGALVQEQLLEMGAAWHASLFDCRPTFIRLHAKAKIDKVGLWARQRPIPPWIWKKNNPR